MSTRCNFCKTSVEDVTGLVSDSNDINLNPSHICEDCVVTCVELFLVLMNKQGKKEIKDEFKKRIRNVLNKDSKKRPPQN